MAPRCSSPSEGPGRKRSIEQQGIKSVRVPGKLIVEDLKAAADLVTDALNA
jgi:hypothetical protein